MLHHSVERQDINIFTFFSLLSLLFLGEWGGMESFFKTFTYGQGTNGALGKKAQIRKQGLLSSVYYVPVPVLSIL